MEVISSSMNVVNGFDPESWVSLQLDDSPSRCLVNPNVMWINSLDYPDLSADPSLILNDSADFITSAGLASPTFTSSDQSGSTEPGPTSKSSETLDQKGPRVVCPESDYNELGFLADLPRDTNVILQPSTAGKAPVGDSPFLEEFKKFLQRDLAPQQPPSGPIPANPVPAKINPATTTTSVGNSVSTPSANPAPATTSAVTSSSVRSNTGSAKVTTTNNNVPIVKPFQGYTAPKVEPSFPILMPKGTNQVTITQVRNNTPASRQAEKITYPFVQAVQKLPATPQNTSGSQALVSANSAKAAPNDSITNMSANKGQVLPPSPNGPTAVLTSTPKLPVPPPAAGGGAAGTTKLPDQPLAAGGVAGTPRSSAKTRTTSSKPRQKRRKRNDDDDDLASLSTPVERRETSSRKAKENCSAKWNQLDKVFDEIMDESEKAPGMDFSDSDDDATWKPEKKRETPFGGFGFGSRNTSGAGGRKRSSTSSVEKGTPSPPSSKKSSPGTTLPPLSSKNSQPGTSLTAPSSKKSSPGTPLVRSDQDFKVGDFVVLKEDIGKEGMVIWKFDSKTLLQKYTPLPPSNEDTVYQSANLFAGYVPWSRSKYASVSVSFVLKSNQKVKIVQIASNDGGDIKRKESMKETSKCFEQFEVFLQALVSQSLDPDFLEEIFNDNDDYFVPKFNAVEEISRKRKAALTRAVNWYQNFEQALDIWPKFLATDTVSATSDCDACRSKVGEVRVTVSGEAYDKLTLKPTLAVNKNLPRSFNVCKQCCSAGNLFHRLVHLKWTLSKIGFKAVEELKAKHPDMDTAKLLATLLEKQSWVEGQFERAQKVWAEADTFNL